MNKIQEDLIKKIDGKYKYYYDSGQLIINSDCLDVMELMEDKSVDLVLTDPPYGIDYGNQLIKGEEFKDKANKHGWKNYGNAQWDKEIPKKEIFDNMILKSKNQIIWGGNYFAHLLNPSQGWLVWDKGQRNFSLADGELAWTSFDKAMRIKTISRGKALQDHKTHPTQKSLDLFIWCLNLRCEENELILDCFSGSGTTAIASYKTKRNSICIELDEEYFEKSCNRLKDECNQLHLF